MSGLIFLIKNQMFVTPYIQVWNMVLQWVNPVAKSGVWQLWALAYRFFYWKEIYFETVNGQSVGDFNCVLFVRFRTMTKSPLWYGVLPGGACGMFDPTQTKPYIPPEVSNNNNITVFSLTGLTCFCLCFSFNLTYRLILLFGFTLPDFSARKEFH